MEDLLNINRIANSDEFKAALQMPLSGGTVAVARVNENGESTLYAARSGNKNFTQEQIAKLQELGVPEKNILTGAATRDKEDKDANHAERVIERNIPEGAEIEEMGISWGENQKNEMCSKCNAHFG